MMMDIRCPKCNALIAERVPLDDKGNFAVDRAFRWNRQEPGSDVYVIPCPDERCDGYLRAVPAASPPGEAARYRIVG